MSLAVKQQLTGIFAPVGESLLGVVQLAARDPAAGGGNGGRDKRDETRYLCLTAKRNGKNKLNKVKYAGGTYNVTKSWVVTDMTVLEVVDKYTFITVFGRPQQWQATDAHAKDEFLATMLKLAKKKPPRLVNVDNRLMKASNYDLLDEGGDTSESNAAPGADTNGEAKPAATAEDELYLGQAAELVNIDDLLRDLNWKSNNSATAVERKLQQELVQLESDNIHALIESTARTQLIVAQIDKAVQKLDAMQSWISGYATSLAQIAPQVQYIQDRNRVSQANARNQARLKETLATFLASLAVPAQLEDVLRRAPLAPPHLPDVERAAQALLAAQHTQLDQDLGHLAVVREQTDRLRDLTGQFAHRVVDALVSTAGVEAEAARGDRARVVRARAQLRLPPHTDRELALAPLRGLALWLREAEPRAFQDVLAGYVGHIAPVFRAELRELLEGVKIAASAAPPAAGGAAAGGGRGAAPSGDEAAAGPAEYLFTAHAASSGVAAVAGSVSAGLSKNLAGSKNTLANALGRTGGHARKESSNPTGGKLGGTLGRGGNTGASSPNLMAGESDGATGKGMDFGTAFAIGLAQIVPTVYREQNFVVGFFHLYPNPPSFESRSPKVNPRRWIDALPNYPVPPSTADLVRDVVSAVFDGLPADLNATADVGLARDPGSAIAMLNAVEKQVAAVRATVATAGPARNGSQEWSGSTEFGPPSPSPSAAAAADGPPNYLQTVLVGLQAKLRAAWAKCVEQQVKAVQEAKYSKKRTGVLSFVRIYPRFVDRLVETVEAPPEPVRRLLDNALDTVLRAVVQAIESLPVVDDEVLILENAMYLYGELRSGPAGSIAALDDHLARLQALSAKHADEYVAHLLQKAMGKLVDFVAGLEALLATQTPEEVAFHQAYAKAVAKKVVGAWNAKDVAKACEYVHRKIAKTLADPGVIDQVWELAQRELERVHERTERVCFAVYLGEVEVEFTAADVRTACAQLK
ncbi:hypothetical protein H9P43_001654 [Blastocladiella emersonii ATCC 22665]|nr:hypothetical protein H9P43_001654 [Blastocladiella emersonii ATCC 22665]